MQLVINAGSSSLKYCLFSSSTDSKVVLKGIFDGVGGKCFHKFGGVGFSVEVGDHTDAVNELVEFLASKDIMSSHVKSVVHRVVHGGERYHHAVVVTSRVEHDISSLSKLAPLHNPANLAGIKACKRFFPSSVQVAVFDTAFHHTIHPEAFRYAIPKQLYTNFGIRKYGFHGINHAYIASCLKDHFGKHVPAISAHLGSGSSLTALKNGHSVDTTMGFTPLDGLVMSTRSGGLDPEIPLFLQREVGLSASQVEDMLQHKSGLAGLTGSGDLRVVYQRSLKGDDDAKLAIDILSYRVAWFVNALRTAVPDFEVLVFTAGIGENAWYVRQQVCDFLRIPLDEKANLSNKKIISDSGSSVTVMVVPANEQLQMHLEAGRVLSQ